MSQLPDYIYIPESFKHSTLDFVTAYLDFEEAENSGYEKGCLQEYIPSYRHEEGVRDAKKELIDKACQWIESYLFDIGFPDDWCRDSTTMKSGKQRFLETMEE